VKKILIVAMFVILLAGIVGCGSIENKISDEISQDQKAVVKPSPTSETLLYGGGGDFQRIKNGFFRYMQANWRLDPILEMAPYVAFDNQVWVIRSIGGVRAWGSSLYGNFVFYSQDYGDNWVIQWNDTGASTQDLYVREIQALDRNRIFIWLANDPRLTPNKSVTIYTLDGGRIWQRSSG